MVQSTLALICDCLSECVLSMFTLNVAQILQIIVRSISLNSILSLSTTSLLLFILVFSGAGLSSYSIRITDKAINI